MKKSVRIIYNWEIKIGNLIRQEFEKRNFEVQRYCELNKKTKSEIYLNNSEMIVIINPKKEEIPHLNFKNYKRKIFIYSLDTKVFNSKYKTEKFFIEKEGELEKFVKSLN